MTEPDGPRVMLVDDHPVWIEAMSGDLEAAGFRIVATPPPATRRCAGPARPVPTYW